MVSTPLRVSSPSAILQPCQGPSNHLTVASLMHALQPPHQAPSLPCAPVHQPWFDCAPEDSFLALQTSIPRILSQMLPCQGVDSQHPTFLCPPTLAHLNLGGLLPHPGHYGPALGQTTQQPSLPPRELQSHLLQPNRNPSLREGLPIPRLSFLGYFPLGLGYLLEFSLHLYSYSSIRVLYFTLNHPVQITVWFLSPDWTQTNTGKYYYYFLFRHEGMRFRGAK